MCAKQKIICAYIGKGNEMKIAVIFAGVIAVIALAVLATVNYAVGLAINRNAGFDKVSKGDPEVHAGWSRYTDELRQGMDWLRTLPGEDLYIDSFDGLRLYAKLCRHDMGEAESGAEVRKNCDCESRTADMQQGDRHGESCEKSCSGIVILSPGYRSSPYKDFSVSGKLLFESGYDLLIVNQRAQGKSEGRYICFGQSEAKDIAAWSRMMEKQYAEDAPIYMFGVSMGATTVILAMGEDLSPRVKAVVADCGFSSAEKIVKHMIRKVLHMPEFPLYELADRAFRRRTGCTFSRSTETVLAESALPLLLVHGNADGFVYPWMSELNYEASAAGPSDKKLLLIEGANHAQSFLTEPEKVGQAVLDFLDKHR